MKGARVWLLVDAYDIVCAPDEKTPSVRGARTPPPEARGRRVGSHVGLDFDGAGACVGEHSVEGEDGSFLGFGVDGDDIADGLFVVGGWLSVGI